MATKGKDTRIDLGGGWKQSPSSGVKIGPRTPARTQPAAAPEDDWNAKLQQLVQPAALTAPMGNANGNTGGGGRSGGGGGGGGGGIDPAQIRASADQLFQVNPQPYFMQQAAIDQQIGQANAYNPDFGAMGNEFAARQAAIDAQRQAAVQQRLAAIGQLGGQLAGEQTGMMQGALRDLQAQGVAPGRYIDQANQVAGDRTAALGNQGQYEGQLNALSANSAADALRSSGLITQGGQANLANNRGELLNSLNQQTAQVQMQAAQQQQQMDQARREYLLKYGVM